MKENDLNNISAYIKDPPTNVQGKSADSDDIMVQTIPKIDEFTKESISLTPALLPLEIEMQQSKKSRDSVSKTSRSSSYSSRSSSTSSSSSSSSSSNSKTNDNFIIDGPSTSKLTGQVASRSTSAAKKVTTSHLSIQMKVM
ncbi:unnamed protein product [Parnassius apollo]|uniref:(apollo) hypothetical protein n=1 Tax=Parnassius apollo TaxID=110799 RepID=A0A8S3X1H7_PARAO|nr:unnamed protein product [Parnassius apollo]